MTNPEDKTIDDYLRSNESQKIEMYEDKNYF